MDYFDILLAKKLSGGGDTPIPDNAYLLKEVDGLPKDIATFSDGANLPMPSLKVSIEPIQSGSGDPSPSNVRPISGWTESSVTRCGKNLYPHNGISIYDYAFSQQIAFSQMRNPIFMKGGQKYVLSLSDNITLFRMRAFDKFQNLVTDASIVNAHNQGSGTGLVFYANGNFFGYNGAGANSITTFQPTEDIWFDMTVQTTSPSQVMFEIGDIPSSYEPYNRHTTTIPFTDGDNPLTVYGGSLDVTSGELVVNKLFTKGATAVRVGQTGSGVKYADTTNVYTGLVQNALTISDRYIQIDTSQSGEDGKFRAYNGEFTIYDNRFTDTTTAQSYLNDVEFCYELATPITYQLTPTQVNSLLGSNNVWADTGDIEELSYFSKLSEG